MFEYYITSLTWQSKLLCTFYIAIAIYSFLLHLSAWQSRSDSRAWKLLRCLWCVDDRMSRDFHNSLMDLGRVLCTSSRGDFRKSPRECGILCASPVGKVLRYFPTGSIANSARMPGIQLLQMCRKSGKPRQKASADGSRGTAGNSRIEYLPAPPGDRGGLELAVWMWRPSLPAPADGARWSVSRCCNRPGDTL